MHTLRLHPALGFVQLLVCDGGERGVQGSLFLGRIGARAPDLSSRSKTRAGWSHARAPTCQTRMSDDMALPDALNCACILHLGLATLVCDDGSRERGVQA